MTNSYVQREWRQEPSRTPELLNDSHRTPFPPQPHAQNSLPSTDQQGAPQKDLKLRFTGSEEILTRLKSSNYLQPSSAVPESTSAQLSAIAAVRFLAAGSTSGVQENHAKGTTVQEREHTRNSNKNAVVAPHRRHYDEIVPMTTAGHKMNAILSYVAKTLDAELPGKSPSLDKPSSSGSSTRKSVSSVASDASSQQPTSTISDFLSMASSDSSVSSDHQTWLLRQRNAEQHHHFAVSTSQSLISQQNQFTPHPPSYDGTGSPHPPSSSHPSPPTPPRLPQSRSASFSRKSLTSRFHAMADPLPEEEDMQSLSSFGGSHGMGDRSSNSRTSDASRKWLGATSVPQPPSASATFTRATRHSSASGPSSRISLPGNGSMKGNEVLDTRTASMLHGSDARGYTTDGYSPSPPLGSLAGNFTSNALGMAIPASLDDSGNSSRRSSRASISGGGSVCSTAARSMTGSGRPLLSRSSTTSFASRKEETVDALLSEQELGKSIHQLHQSGRNDPLAVALQRTLARERARRHSSAAGAEIPASHLPGNLDSSSSVATQLSEISRSWVASQALNSPTLFEVLERQSKDKHIFPEQQGPFSEPASVSLTEKYHLLTQCATLGDNRGQPDASSTTNTLSGPGKHFFPTPDPTLIPPPPAPVHRLPQRSASLSRMTLSHKPQHPLALSSNDLDLQSLRESIMYQRSSSLATNHGPVLTSTPTPEPSSQRYRASDDGAFRQHVQAYHSILTNPSHTAAEEEEESEDTVAPLSLVDQRLSAMRLSLSEKKIKPGSGTTSTRRHGSESGYGSGGRPLSTAALLAHGVTTSNGTSTSQWAAKTSTTHSIVDGGERGSGGRLPRAATMTATTSGGRQSPAGAVGSGGIGGAGGAPASADNGGGGVVSSARRSISKASSFNSRGRA